MRLFEGHRCVPAVDCGATCRQQNRAHLGVNWQPAINNAGWFATTTKKNNNLSSLTCNIARNAGHFTAKWASSAFVTIERLSHKDQRPPRWSVVAAAMIFTGRPSQKARRSPWSCLLLLVDFSLSFFSWLLHDGSCSRFASGDHLIVNFLVCLCLRVWMVGIFANLTICLSY